MSIVIEHLSFSYGRRNVLDDVHVAAEPGRLIALIGPNAAGKSTLLRCIIGALAPRAGRALIHGVATHRMTAGQLAARVAYVPQRPVVSAAFTVRQVVALGRFALPPNPRRIEQAIDQMDLRDVAERPFPALSVGQQQRVTMARALAQLGDSGGLVLDEPWSALDLRHVHHCIAATRAAAQRGATVLIAMHDLTLAAAIADDVWMLQGGRLVAAGPVGAVMGVEQLREVFEVEFGWVGGPEGRHVLLPRVDARGERGADTLEAQS
jgi:iron complex transport system ATP-binding protein